MKIVGKLVYICVMIGTFEMNNFLKKYNINEGGGGGID